MVCLRNMCIDTLHKADNDDDDNNNNNIYITAIGLSPGGSGSSGGSI